MYSEKIHRLFLILAQPSNLVEKLTDEEKKFGSSLQKEGIKADHLGTFPTVNLSVFLLPEDAFSKAGKIKHLTSYKTINLLKPSNQNIFSHFKKKETLEFLLLYGDDLEKYKNKINLASRVYHLEEKAREERQRA